MPQAEAVDEVVETSVRTEPYLKYYTPEEIDDMGYRVANLLDDDQDEEAWKLLKEIPLLPKSAKIWKELHGVADLIASGINLYEVVQEYGEDWLKQN